MDQKIMQQLPSALLPWYARNKRQLPWRENKDPYRVWLSEVMLQQTRVEAVKGYYARFLAALPSVEALANCDDDALHKLWEGLGYYSRVRNLKKCAQVLVGEHGGAFPRDYGKILALPGIGEYTAGAICSICFDMPVPAVDGNVLRVIARLTREERAVDLPAYKKEVRIVLQKVYPAAAGDFTQALMELGATVCGPDKKPDCANCPCRTFCESAIHGCADKYPVRLPKREKRVQERTVLICCCDGRYALKKRPAKGLLAGLWEFPNVPGKLTVQSALDLAQQWGLAPRQVLRSVERSHVFTHIRWEMQGIYLQVDSCPEDFTWLSAEQIDRDAALPTAFRQFWEEV